MNRGSLGDEIAFYKRFIVQILVNQIMYFQPKSIHSPLGSQTETKIKKIELRFSKQTANQLVDRNPNHKMYSLIENELKDRIFQKQKAVHDLLNLEF